MKTQTSSRKGKDTSSNQPVDSRIAAVRDLIFGENMQQYDKDFNEVSGQIAALKKETDKNFADLASTLQSKIDALQKSTEASIKKLATGFEDKIASDIDKKLERLDDAKADRKKLGKALEKIALMLQG